MNSISNISFRVFNMIFIIMIIPISYYCPTQVVISNTVCRLALGSYIYIYIYIYISKCFATSATVHVQGHCFDSVVDGLQRSNNAGVPSKRFNVFRSCALMTFCIEHTHNTCTYTSTYTCSPALGSAVGLFPSSSHP
jgi:hypothetical protein